MHACCGGDAVKAQKLYEAIRAESARRERRRRLVRYPNLLLEPRGEVPRRPEAKSRGARDCLRRREGSREHVLQERDDEEAVTDIGRELWRLVAVLV